MDFAWNPIMDAVLNLTGYLAAGALALVVYRIFKDRPIRQASIAAAAVGTVTQTEPETASAERSPSRLRFVKLGEIPADPTSHGKVAIDTANSRPLSTPTRVEIIRLARRMLDSGASMKRIRQVLPVSESELALLDNGKNR